MKTEKTYRRQYTLIADFAAAHVDPAHRPAAQAACDALNAAAAADRWIDKQSAILYGAGAIAATSMAVVIRCDAVAR